MKKYKAGIIGCGRIGFLLEEDKLRMHPCTHSRMFFNDKEFELVAGCDINKNQLKKFKEKYNVKNLFTNIDDFIKNIDKLDCISVCTWTPSHYEILKKLIISKSAKIIISEKPITETVEQAQEILQLAKKNNIIVIVNHERRWHNLYKTAKKIIRQKKIGEIRTVIANVLTGKWKIKGKRPENIEYGPLMHDGTHLVDILNFLFGNPVNVKGKIVEKGTDYESRTIGIIEYKNDIYCFLEAGGSRGYFNFELDIQGTNGRLKIGNGYQMISKVEQSKHYTGFKELEKFKTFDYKWENPYENLIKEIKLILKGKKKKSISSGEDGLLALKIIHKIYQGKI